MLIIYAYKRLFTIVNLTLDFDLIGVEPEINLKELDMTFYPNRQLTYLASSISVLAIATGLVVGQSATHKSLAQTSTTPPPTGVTSINGAGASSITTLFIGTGTTSPFDPKGSWFNTYGVGNPSSLNPPGPVNAAVTFRYASVGSGKGLTAFFTQTVPAGSPTINRPVSFAASDDPVVGTEKVSGFHQLQFQMLLSVRVTKMQMLNGLNS